jgi:uncharacterized protein (TIGR02145 family)
MKKTIVIIFSFVMLISFVFAQQIDTLKDQRDGRVYKTVQIGDQVWMADNLNTSVFTDGTKISEVASAFNWSDLNTGAWSWYGNNSFNGDVYGRLYNWYAVMGIHDLESKTNIALRKKICPIGWHVPSDEEWSVLGKYLGKNAGHKLKSAGWLNSKGTTKDNSGFNALPGGYRDLIGGFEDLENDGYWWSATEYDNGFAWNRSLFYDSGSFTRYVVSNVYGYSVRCLKDK